MKKHTKIKAGERDRIAVLLASGISIRSIARELCRSHSSILSEIKKNSEQKPG
ncbi:MAG: helix-turn-helix domain-containing protein [Patescibacteria group bacterium]